MPIVFVIGEDWHLRANVRAELREHGIEALGMESLEEAERTLAHGTIRAAVVFDAGTADASSPVLASMAQRVPLILVASRTSATPTPESAAAVLWRPVLVGDVVEKVKELLKGRAA